MSEGAAVETGTRNWGTSASDTNLRNIALYRYLCPPRRRFNVSLATFVKRCDLLLPNLDQNPMSLRTSAWNAAFRRASNCVGIPRLSKFSCWSVNLAHANTTTSCMCRCNTFSSATAGGGSMEGACARGFHRCANMHWCSNNSSTCLRATAAHGSKKSSSCGYS